MAHCNVTFSFTLFLVMNIAEILLMWRKANKFNPNTCASYTEIFFFGFVPHDQRNRLSGLLQHVDYMFNTHGVPSWVQQYKKQQRQHKRKIGQQKLDNKYWSDTGINVQLKLLNTCMSVCFVLFFLENNETRNIIQALILAATVTEL